MLQFCALSSLGKYKQQSRNINYFLEVSDLNTDNQSVLFYVYINKRMWVAFDEAATQMIQIT